MPSTVILSSLAFTVEANRISTTVNTVRIRQSFVLVPIGMTGHYIRRPLIRTVAIQQAAARFISVVSGGDHGDSGKGFQPSGKFRRVGASMLGSRGPTYG